jgi:TetR/AcrR family transcriptional regulator, mexCD-oprJ operon repressor
MAVKPRERAVRSDAIRNRDAILQAAAVRLTEDPNASLADIAQAAGIGRVTLYGHFSSREELLTALLHRSMQRVEEQLSSVDLGGDPWEALDALVASSWKVLYELNALRGVVERAMPQELSDSHDHVRARVKALLARGRDDGSFRTDQGLDWQLACYFSIVHGAGAELRAGHLTEPQVTKLLPDTIRALLRRPHK